MRIALGFGLLVISIVIALFRYDEFSIRSKNNEFFYVFSSKIIANNTREMQPFHSVFNETASSFYSKEVALNDSEDVFKYVEQNLSNSIDNKQIIDALLSFTKSGEDKISESGNELTEITENAYKKAALELNKYGKTAFILYPSAALIAIIALI